MIRDRTTGGLSVEDLDWCENELRDEKRVLKREIGRAKKEEWRRGCTKG